MYSFYLILSCVIYLKMLECTFILIQETCFILEGIGYVFPKIRKVKTWWSHGN